MPDLQLSRAKHAVQLCGEVSTESGVFVPVADEMLPDPSVSRCTLKLGPQSHICSSARVVAPSWLLGAPGPLAAFDRTDDARRGKTLMHVEVTGPPEAPQYRVRAGFGPNEDIEPEPDFVRTLSLHLNGLGTVAMGHSAYDETAPASVFSWPDIDASAHGPAPFRDPLAAYRATLKSVWYIITPVALCVAAQIEGGWLVGRALPEAGDDALVVPFAGSLIRLGRPAFMRERFDGRLEIRDLNDDCTGLGPLRVRAPTFGRFASLWDGEVLWDRGTRDGVDGIVATSAPDERSFISDPNWSFSAEERMLAPPTASSGAPMGSIRLILVSPSPSDPGRTTIRLFGRHLEPLGGLTFEAPAWPVLQDARVADGRIDLIFQADGAGGFWHVPIAINCD